MKKRLFSAVLAAVCLSLPAASQITIKKQAGYAVDLAGLQADGAPGAVFKRTLANDLTRSGAFTVVPSEGSYPVTGVFTPPASARIEVRTAAFSRTFTAPDGDPRRLAHIVGDALLQAIADEKPYLNSRFILSGNRSGHWELYVCDSDGENLRQITQDRSLALYPSWAPDGKTVVFTSYRRRFPDLYTIDMTRWTLTPLADFNGMNTSGAYSPNGKEMAMTLSFDGNPELYIMRAPVRGGRLFRLTRTAAAETGATWSPDGKKIAFVSDSSGSPQIWILDRDTGGKTKLNVAGSENVSPAWGPDGRIAFCSRRAGRYRICLFDPATGEVTDLTGDTDNFEDPGWAPDGRHLSCTRTSGGGSVIYILDTKGKPSIPLMKVEGSWRSASWSPLLP